MARAAIALFAVIWMSVGATIAAQATTVSVTASLTQRVTNTGIAQRDRLNESGSNICGGSQGGSVDGVNDCTRWIFDFKNDPNYAQFLAVDVITGASFSMDRFAGSQNYLTGDAVRITHSDVNSSAPQLRTGQVRQAADWNNESILGSGDAGFTSAEILAEFFGSFNDLSYGTTGIGDMRMSYSDDARLNSVSLTLTGVISQTPPTVSTASINQPFDAFNLTASVDGSASDPNGDITGYSWTRVSDGAALQSPGYPPIDFTAQPGPDGLITLASSGITRPRLDASDTDAEVEWRLTATDAEGLSSADTAQARTTAFYQNSAPFPPLFAPPLQPPRTRSIGATFTEYDMLANAELEGFEQLSWAVTYDDGEVVHTLLEGVTDPASTDVFQNVGGTLDDETILAIFGGRGNQSYLIDITVTDRAGASASVTLEYVIPAIPAPATLPLLLIPALASLLAKLRARSPSLSH